MPTPPKPFAVLKTEKKSHRTKAELKQREEGEKALITGKALRERPEVKNNTIAHKEFLRINKLLEIIGKNDAIYEGVINRYCQIYAECFDLEERRKEFQTLIQEIRETFKEFSDDMDVETKAAFLLDLSKELAKISKSMNDIDKLIQQKRKMLFDIERENILTIASALRSIPKKAENKKNALLKALGGD